MEFKNLSQAEKEQDRRMEKQINIVFGAAICALIELPKWNFGKKRLRKFIKESDRILHEQSTGQCSMMEICQKETGIEMKHKGKSYKSIYMFNSDEWYKASEIHDGYIGLTEPQKINNIVETFDWIPLHYEACALIAMHRVFGWGKKKRLPEFMELIEGIRAECRDAQYYKDLLRINYGIVLRIKN